MNNINISTSVAANRAMLSIMGSGLGHQFFQISPREAFPEYKKKIASVAEGGNVEICLNRTPMRYHIFSHDIINVGVEENIAGQPIVYINKRAEGQYDVAIPFTNDMTKYSDVTVDGIKQAIKGDKTKIFANPKKLSSFLNELNKVEADRCRALIKELEKAIQGCESAIVENEKKAAEYERQLEESTPNHVDTIGEGNIPTGGVEVNVHVEK